jgi:hypothetical protein
MSDSIPAPEAPEIVAQDAKVVGDDNLEVREVSVDVNKDTVAAQVAPEREAPSDKVYQHEVAVALDEVITDPSSPLAVQIPDAGRGFLDLPIHRLDAKRPEDVFAAEASQADEDSDDESSDGDSPRL